MSIQRSAHRTRCSAHRLLAYAYLPTDHRPNPSPYGARLYPRPKPGIRSKRPPNNPLQSILCTIETARAQYHRIRPYSALTSSASWTRHRQSDRPHACSRARSVGCPVRALSFPSLLEEPLLLQYRPSSAQPSPLAFRPSPRHLSCQPS